MQSILRYLKAFLPVNLFIPALLPNLSSCLKPLLRKCSIFTFAFLIANFVFIDVSFGQVTLRGTQTATTANTTLTITKPTGLAVNDMMLVDILQSGTDNNDLSDATSSGWIQIAGSNLNTGNNRYRGTLLYKIASATDVAGTSFSFVLDNQSDDGEGSIVAYSGVAVIGGVTVTGAAGGPFDVTPGNAYTNIASDNTLTATSITTASANAAVIMFGVIADNLSITNASWSTTSPGVLGELFDFAFDATLDMGIGAAWALKPTVGATGGGTATLSAIANNGAILIALKPCAATPTLTTTGTASPVCFSSSSQTTTLAYTASTNSPTSFGIDWNTTANSAGLTDQGSTAHTFLAGGGTITGIIIPASVPAGTYNGTLYISIGNGCTNAYPINVTVNAAATANAGSALNPVCQGGTSAALGGSVGGSATGGTWSDGGIGGIFNSGATNLNTTYTPPSGFSGTVVLTLTTSGGSCGTTASKNLMVNILPVTSGVTICQGSTGSLTSSTTCTDFPNAGTTISGTFNATTDPTALRPATSNDNSSTCSFTTTGVTRNYVAISFQVSTTGNYIFTMTNNDNYDGMGYIVSGAFVPGNCSGGGTWIRGDDDDGPGDEPRLGASGIGNGLMALTAGVTYTLISTTYSTTTGTVSGSFSWTITGGQVLPLLQWYTVATGGSAIGTGSPFNPVGVSGSGLANTNTPGTTIFYAQCSSGQGCRTATNFVINPNPAAPTSGGNVTACQSATPATLSATPPSGSTVDWYASATGGTALQSSSNTYSTSTAGTYYAESRNTTTGCTSTTRTAVTLTVNPNPAAPTSGGNVTACQSATPATLTATPPSGSTVDWYASATGGTALQSSSNTYSTSTAGTYYAESRNTTTGCKSTTRTAVTLTVNPNPAAPTSGGNVTACQSATPATLTATPPSGSTVDWYASATGGTALQSSSNTYSTSTAGTYYAESRNTTTGCKSTTRTAVTLTVNPNPAAPTSGGNVTACQSATPATLTATPPSGSTVDWYASATGGTALQSSSNTYSTSTAGTYYAESRNTTTGCKSTTRTAVTLTVNPNPAAPTSGGNVTACQSATPATLTATPPSGSTVDWYASATGGTALQSSSNTYSTSTAGTYYAESRNTTTGCTSTTRTAVTLTVNPNPAAPTSGGNVTACQSATPATLTATPPSGSTVDWYASATGGTALQSSSNTYSTSTAGTYYAESRNTTTGCTSTTRTAVTLTVNPNPAAPTSGGNVTACQSATPATLTATPPSGSTVDWYASATGGTALQSSSNTYSTSTAGTYYAESRNTTTACKSTSRTAVTLTINPIPTASISGTTTINCQNDPSPNITFTGANGTAPYTVTYNINGGANQIVTSDGMGIATVAVPTNNYGTFTYNLVSVADANCSQNQTGSATVTISRDTWKAGGNGNWNTASNWTCGIPTSTTDVLIPNGATPYPVIGAPSTNSVHNIIIESGATLTLDYSGTDTAVLTITGAYSNSGILANNGKIILKGDVAQNFPGGSVTNPLMNSLEINNTLGVSADRSFTIRGKLFPTTGTLALGASYITLKSDSSNVAGTPEYNTARVGVVGTGASFTYTTGRFVVERYFHSKRAWRLITAPIAKLSSPTIYNSWQLGGRTTTTPAIQGGPAPAGSGVLITGPAPTGPGIDPGVNSQYSLKTYNSLSGALVPVANTQLPLLSPGTPGSTADNIGYFNFVRGDRNPALVGAFSTATDTTTLRDTGRIQTGTHTFTFPLSATPPPIDGGYFILLANPYASPIDFSAIYLANSATIQDKFWAWDPSSNQPVGSYVQLIGDGSGGSYTVVPTSLGGQTQYIQSCQAVYVQTTNASTASVIIKENFKSDATVKKPLFRPLIFTTAQLATNLKFLNADNTTALADGVLAQFSSSFSNAVDQQDGLKFPNVNESFAVAREGRLLTVERRNLLTQSDTLFFNLTKAGQRSYQLEFVAEGLEGNTAYLEDSYLKTSTPVNMSGTTTVNFSLNADAGSQAADRFRIVFRPAAPLPVTFTKVKAYQQGSSINVEWMVNNELNMQAYELERSADGSHFTKIATAAALQNNGRQASYTSPDAAPFNGANYYRIHSISRSGEDLYSNVVKVTIGRGAPQISVYPNPIVNGTINLQLTNQPEGSYGVKLLNKLGEVLITKEITHAAGSSTETLQLSKAMAHGIYQLEVTSPGKIKKNINVSY